MSLSLESRVDVLIIGAGPAGVMCANALGRVGVDVRIIDKRPAKVAAGQADGIQPRTIEVFQSYGLAERLIREGNQTHMCSFYNPGPNGGIECKERSATGDEPDLARFPFGVTLSQGGIESMFLDSMRSCGVEVERPKRPVDIEVSTDANELRSASSYPVKVTLESIDAINEESKTEIVHAKYLVGSDGAHSWVRNALGIEMEGEQSDYIWGVVDMIPETDFPDIRNIVNIYSDHGSCMIIPREGDMIRFYTQLCDADVVCPSAKRVDRSKITPQGLISVLRKILQPFDLAEPKEIDWWTVYLIGQRVAAKFSVDQRVFIAGDACHTHSPQAGQGMNASMNDTHNLAWKLAQVLKGWASPSLLETYEQERRKYAQDLINFDKVYSTLVSGKPRSEENEEGVSHEQFQEVSDLFSGFMSGFAVHYSPSAIVDPKHQEHAKKLTIGQRMLPLTYVRAADIRPVNIQDFLISDARFKLLFFVGHLTETRIAELKLLETELNILCKYSANREVSTVFDIVTIMAGRKEDMNYMLLPVFYRHHWKKVLLDDCNVKGKEAGHEYEEFGIDPEQITVVVIRPDGYIGTVAPSTAVADIDKYFGSFLVRHGGNM